MDELLRLARELRPAALDDLGLGAALRTQVDEFGRRAGVVDEPEHPRRVSRTSTPTSRSSSTASSRRGCPTSRATRGARSVSVEVERPSGGTVCASPTTGPASPRAPRRRGLGLKGMRERAVLAGGRFYVDSAPGRGTTIELRLGAAA